MVRFLATFILASGLAVSGTAKGPVEPQFAEPAMGEILARLAPHFDAPAGEPTGAVRGKPPYLGESFDVGHPERVMPAGAGRLSAMVAYGDEVELALSTTEYFNALADDTAGQTGKYVNPLLSPGRLSIRLGHATAKEILRFDQRIDFARGRVVIEAETAEGKFAVEVWGDRTEDNLLVSIHDERRAHEPATVRFENWRSTAAVGASLGRLEATEAADVSSESGLRAQSMSLAVEVGCRGGEGFAATANAGIGTIDVPAEAAGEFTVVLSAKCAHGAPPSAVAQESWNRTATASADVLDDQRTAWWAAFWSKGWLDLKGPEADYLMRLWYTSLYSYACVGDGPVPPKFNGGPGLVYKDARSWGDGYWWQNQREIGFWPMAAAGHPDFTRESILFFNHDYQRSLENARNHALPGLLFGEGHRPAEWKQPFGDYPLTRMDLAATANAPRDPAAALAMREGTKAGYNALNFVGGMEFVQSIFDYVQFTGDVEIERQVGVPWLEGETRMVLGFLILGDDQRYHVRCADATEQWWKVDDPSPPLAGIQYLLAMTVRHGPELGLDSALVAEAADRLAHLAVLPTVDSWTYRTEKPGYYWYCPCVEIKPGNQLLAPFAMVEGMGAHNAENPELYAVFPFALFDLNSKPADLELARRTFAHRFFKNTQGWSQCPVQAARLGLPDTLAVILDHAKKHQAWPYGGWNCAAAPLYTGNRVTDCPFFDSAGVNLTALQETLLQSHQGAQSGELLAGGPIRLIPAVGRDWSGQFHLNARGGLGITVRFVRGVVEAASIVATRDATVQLVNPFDRAAVWSQGAMKLYASRTISLGMKSGERLVLASAASPTPSH